MSTTAIAVRSGLRIGYAVVGVATVVAAVLAARHGDGWAVAAAWTFAIAPDLPLLGGMSKGWLNPRMVPFYNATHRLVGPLVLLVAGVVVGSVSGSVPVLAAGLAWTAHVLVDRALGYGLRGKDGWPRVR